MPHSCALPMGHTNILDIALSKFMQWHVKNHQANKEIECPWTSMNPITVDRSVRYHPLSHYLLDLCIITQIIVVRDGRGGVPTLHVELKNDIVHYCIHKFSDLTRMFFFTCGLSLGLST